MCGVRLVGARAFAAARAVCAWGELAPCCGNDSMAWAALTRGRGRPRALRRVAIERHGRGRPHCDRPSDAARHPARRSGARHAPACSEPGRRRTGRADLAGAHAPRPRDAAGRRGERAARAAAARVAAIGCATPHSRHQRLPTTADAAQPRPSLGLLGRARSYPRRSVALFGLELLYTPLLARIRLTAGVEALTGGHQVSDQSGKVAHRSLYSLGAVLALSWASATRPELALGPSLRAVHGAASASASELRAGAAARSGAAASSRASAFGRCSACVLVSLWQPGLAR